jgi:hypothetical protein
MACDEPGNAWLALDLGFVLLGTYLSRTSAYHELKARNLCASLNVLFGSTAGGDVSGVWIFSGRDAEVEAASFSSGYIIDSGFRRMGLLLVNVLSDSV